MSESAGTHAVVVGASMGGLMAARALSDRFDRVTVLERDPLADQPLPRKGVPQGRHTHGLLASGLAALERFFPGIRDELVECGSGIGDVVGDSLWHIEGDFHVRADSGLIGVTQSRPLLEAVVRQRVAALPNVKIRDSVKVKRLVADPSRRRIVGVELTDRREAARETLVANLVIDATGRGSRTPLWLKDFGYAPPREERVEVQLTYATRLYLRRPDDFRGGLGVIVTPLPPNKRNGVALAIEGDCWCLTLGGMFDEAPPADEAGFRQFARGLASPVIHEFLETAEPASDIQIFKYPASVRRRYERLKHFPDGLLVMGDAMASFNPIYGQGMSVAALEAELLHECLKVGQQHLAKRFFRAAARLVDIPWQIAVGADFRCPEVRGRRPLLSGLVGAYLRHVHRAAHRDPEVAVAFHRVANLIDKPSSLFRPRIVWRVLRNGRRAPDLEIAGAYLLERFGIRKACP
jgi:2-polyprenyl-6-methoxyphenol hydroxylase-like FAD-dependent oxidoreductase